MAAAAAAAPDGGAARRRDGKPRIFNSEKLSPERRSIITAVHVVQLRSSIDGAVMCRKVTRIDIVATHNETPIEISAHYGPLNMPSARNEKMWPCMPAHRRRTSTRRRSLRLGRKLYREADKAVMHACRNQLGIFASHAKHRRSERVIETLKARKAAVSAPSSVSWPVPAA